MNSKSLKVKIDRTDAQVDLVKKLGSKNKSESMAAAEALAAVLPQPILQVILQSAVISDLFALQTYDAGTPASIDLDPYFDVRAKNLVQVWGQSQPGGTATNFVQGLSQLYVHTFPMDSAISMNKNALRAAKLDYLGASLTKMTQEVLVQAEANNANILMGSLAGARIDFDKTNNAVTNLTLARSNAAGVFSIADFNTLVTNYDRVVSSWVGGTPSVDKGGITVLLGSPEWMGQVRALAYQPVNTRNGATVTSGASSLAAPEELRAEILRNAGVSSFFGIELRKVWEMGKGRDYNTLFDNYIGSQAIIGNGGTGSAQFNGSTEEIVVGLNPNMFDLVTLRESEGGNELSIVPDDTFSVRSDKIGFVASVKQGSVSVDGRAKYGMIF